MQHYRLPTRLLDWTESSLVAAFFAANYHPESDGALWALDPMALNGSQVGTPRLLSASGTVAGPLFRPPFKNGASQQDKTLAVLAKEIDVRMLIQQSVFTVHGAATQLDILADSNVFLRKLIVPAASKARIRAELTALGFKLHTLFPDLEHLAADLAALRFVP